MSTTTTHLPQRFTGLVALACLLASSWLLADSQAPQTPNSAKPVATPIWLQNPWTGDTQLTRVLEPDTSLWNAKRIDDYHAALQADAAPPVGVMTISRLNLQAPVYNGANEFILDRGLGRIPGMARIGEAGNLGISGHRDGFFRGLKDIEPGDKIMLRLPGKVEIYAVDGISIVDKHDHHVLGEQTGKQLTLVTCYPFYFVGHAPQRYIVHASPFTESEPEVGLSAQ